MKTLDLEKVRLICNTLSDKRYELAEDNIYIDFLGHRSNYVSLSFEGFLEYYSFKIDDYIITVFNDDAIPYESYTNDDYSYFPSVLLSFGEKDLEDWVENEIKTQLAKQEKEKKAEKERLKNDIERLKKQLENLK
jgi:hypothetical protein